MPTPKDDDTPKPRLRVRDRADLWLVLCLVAFNLLVRLATLRGPHLGGDAMHTWFMSRILTEGLSAEPWVWDHHTARLTVIGWSIAVQALLGSHTLLYYLPALGMSCVQVVLIWKIGQRLGARFAASVAALALVLSPGMVRTGADLLPEVFAGAYLLLGVLLLHDRVASETPRSATLVGAALAFFAAYLAKLPSAFVLPGVVAGLWLAQRRPKDALLLLAIFLGCIAVETGLYALFTDFPGGRLQVIANTHLGHPKLAPIGFWDLFRRFDAHNMSGGLRWLLLGAAGLGLLLAARPRGVARFTWTLALGIASFVLGMTFAVKSIAPLAPAQPPVERYFNAILPLLWLYVCLGVTQAAAALRLLPDWPPQRLRRVGAGAFALLVVWVVIVEGPGFERRRTVATLVEQRRLANAAFADGTPMFTLNRDERPLKAVRDLLLRDYAELGYPEQAPRVAAGPRAGQRGSYVLANASVLRPGSDVAGVGQALHAWQASGRAILRISRGPGRELLIEQTTLNAPAR